MFTLRRILACLAVPLLAAVAGAQLLPPDVWPLPVPGGVELLLTRLDPGGLSTTSVLLAPPGGSQSSQSSHSSGPSVQSDGMLPIEDGPQRFLTRWSEASGATHLLLTQDLPSESPDQHAARHAAALAVLLVQFPPAASVSDSATPLENGAQAFKTSWLGLDTLEHEVITVRKSGETLDKWAERHAAGVSAMLKLFPPKPSSPTTCLAGRALHVA